MTFAAPRRLSAPQVAAAAAAVVALAAAPASAQVPTVEPDGTLSDPAASPPPEKPAPRDPEVIVVGPDGEAEAVETGEGGPEGFYYSDGAPLYPGLGLEVDPRRGEAGRAERGPAPAARSDGRVPAAHVVRRGDTLWDICWYYFNNPWEWPRVWSYNPQITNPHWIYPGDEVRLRPSGEVEGGAGEGEEPAQERDKGAVAAAPAPASSDRGWFSIRQLAFVDREGLEYAATVEGSTYEKLLLAEGDTVYLAYPEDRPPEVGARYAVYSEKRTVEHPETGEDAGAYVRIVGEVEILSVAEGKRARARITDSAAVVERGYRVGPLQRTFKDVEPAPNEVDLQGTIVAQLEADQLIGARQVVFLDRGAAHGVREGNRMYVVRRGDAYPEPGGRVSNRGLDDRRYPAHALGEILVVQAGEQTSVGLVSLSVQEIEPGDRVVMRASGGSPE